MLPHERYEKILEILKSKNIIKVEDIMSTFNVSIETARRDITHLDNAGLIKKIYGGATSVKNSQAEPISTNRLSKNTEEKMQIGKKCSEFINDGDSILLEIGTTTLQIAKFIKNKKNLTVFTNSIYIINELIDTDINLYVIGGKVRHDEKAISGAVSMFDLDNFNIDKAFIGAGGITPRNGISDYNIEEAVIRKKIIERSKEIFLAADHSKFGFDLLVNVCPISAVDLIITGSNINHDILEELKKNNANVVLTD